MADTRIQAIKDYFQTYIDSADANKPLWVNYLNQEPVSYSIVPIAGTRKISTYVHGNSGEREFVFAFQSSRFTADEAERIGNIEFFETLAEWLDDQTELGNLPELPTGFNVSSVEALGDGYLFEQGDSQTGIYQIQMRMEYSKS